MVQCATGHGVGASELRQTCLPLHAKLKRGQSRRCKRLEGMLVHRAFERLQHPPNYGIFIFDLDGNKNEAVTSPNAFVVSAIFLPSSTVASVAPGALR